MNTARDVRERRRQEAKTKNIDAARRWWEWNPRPPWKLGSHAEQPQEPAIALRGLPPSPLRRTPHCSRSFLRRAPLCLPSVAPIRVSRSTTMSLCSSSSSSSSMSSGAGALSPAWRPFEPWRVLPANGPQSLTDRRTCC